MSHRPPSVGRISAALAFCALITMPGVTADTRPGPDVETREAPGGPYTGVQRADQDFRCGRVRFHQGIELTAMADVERDDARRRSLRAEAVGRFENSVAAAGRCIDLALKTDASPDDVARVYRQHGDALFKLARFDEASAAYAEALIHSPASLRARYGHALAALALDDHDTLRRDWEALLREAETRGEAWEIVDALLAAMRRSAGGSADETDDYVAWVVEQQALIDDAVRWILLEEPE